MAAKGWVSHSALLSSTCNCLNQVSPGAFSAPVVLTSTVLAVLGSGQRILEGQKRKTVSVERPFFISSPLATINIYFMAPTDSCSLHSIQAYICFQSERQGLLIPCYPELEPHSSRIISAKDKDVLGKLLNITKYYFSHFG